MSGRSIIFLTHAQVVIDPNMPVPDWPLDDLGRSRHRAFNANPVLAGVTAIYSSAERKALDGAEIHAEALKVPHMVVRDLHENDRSSTGYLPEPEFQAMADRFFASPEQSVDGWERASDAQLRIVTATRTIADLDKSGGDILIVAHGGVGTLLLSDCLQRPIGRDADQQAGGGNYFIVDAANWNLVSPWRAIP